MARPSKREKPVFAINIVAKRKARGWNAHNLAEKARIPYPTLRDIEAGINAGREETKEAIARALECSVSELYDDGTSREIRPTPNQLKGLIESTPDEIPFGPLSLVMERFSKEPPEVRAAVLALLFDDESISEPYLADTTSTRAKVR
jgi:transcriptional regulator with XRE-family HTH domain